MNDGESRNCGLCANCVPAKACWLYGVPASVRAASLALVSAAPLAGLALFGGLVFLLPLLPAA